MQTEHKWSTRRVFGVADGFHASRRAFSVHKACYQESRHHQSRKVIFCRDFVYACFIFDAISCLTSERSGDPARGYPPFAAHDTVLVYVLQEMRAHLDCAETEGDDPQAAGNPTLFNLIHIEKAVGIECVANDIGRQFESNARLVNSVGCDYVTSTLIAESDAWDKSFTGTGVIQPHSIRVGVTDRVVCYRRVIGADVDTAVPNPINELEIVFEVMITPSVPAIPIAPVVSPTYYR